MSPVKGKYLLDANVLINAHRRYYAHDICPGFWKAVRKGFDDGCIFSTKRVKDELLPPGDFISAWIKKELPADFFIDDSTKEARAAFTPMMSWVATQGYMQAAVAEFAVKADGWLVAAAKQRDFSVVTLEALQQSGTRTIKIPNVCEHFKVRYCNTFEMLRNLSFAFH